MPHQHRSGREQQRHRHLGHRVLRVRELRHRHRDLWKLHPGRRRQHGDGTPAPFPSGSSLTRRVSFRRADADADVAAIVHPRSRGAQDQPGHVPVPGVLHGRAGRGGGRQRRRADAGVLHQFGQRSVAGGARVSGCDVRDDGALMRCGSGIFSWLLGRLIVCGPWWLGCGVGAAMSELRIRIPS